MRDKTRHFAGHTQSRARSYKKLNSKVNNETFREDNNPEFPTREKRPLPAERPTEDASTLF
jgi:hypothetical protein